MEQNREEQKEALETLIEFNQRLVKNMNIIVKELSGQRLDDTDKFLKSILEFLPMRFDRRGNMKDDRHTLRYQVKHLVWVSIIWEVQVMNGTMDLLNEAKERINKEEFNSKITELSTALKEKDDVKQAAAIQNLIPSFELLEAAAREVIA